MSEKTRITRGHALLFYLCYVIGEATYRGYPIHCHIRFRAAIRRSVVKRHIFQEALTGAVPVHEGRAVEACLAAEQATRSAGTDLVELLQVNTEAFVAKLLIFEFIVRYINHDARTNSKDGQ